MLQGVIVAIGATLLYILMRELRPRDALLGRVPGREGFYKLHRYPNGQPIAGMAIYLLQGNLQFFNADYVRLRIEETIKTLPEGTRWYIFDAGASAHIDSTAAAMLDDLCTFIEERGLKFGIVELHSAPRDILMRAGVLDRIGENMVFDDLEDAVAAFSVREGDIAPLKS